jgi:hypothetical protein
MLTGEIKMKCPVCGSPAEPLPRTFEGDGYRCKACGDFGISGTVPSLEKWEKLDRGGRLQALATAKSQAKPGELPKITSYSF